MSESRPLFTWESLEGEYRTWVLMWVRDFSLTAQLSRGSRVDNYGTVYVIDQIGARTTIRDRAGNEQLALNLYVDWSITNSQHSVGNKYILMTDGLVTTIFRVYRRGAEIFNRDILLDAPAVIDIDQTAMSPNGRYVVINARLGAPPARVTLLYEGR